MNLIADYVGFPDDQPQLKNTTNSVIVEYSQLANFWFCDYYRWKELVSRKIPS